MASKDLTQGEFDDEDEEDEYGALNFKSSDDDGDENADLYDLGLIFLLLPDHFLSSQLRTHHRQPHLPNLTKWLFLFKL